MTPVLQRTMPTSELAPDSSTASTWCCLRFVLNTPCRKTILDTSDWWEGWQKTWWPGFTGAKSANQGLSSTGTTRSKRVRTFSA
jgi:hypothetical protein